MKRLILSVFLLICSISLKAQLNTQLLYNTWIKVKVVYNDDKLLEYANAFKYSYDKYIFTEKGKVGINSSYTSARANNNFMTNDSTIIITSSSGYQINKYKILKLSVDELILLQDNGSGSEKPSDYKIYLIPESRFQKSHVFQPGEFSLAANGDTVYNESPYMYPVFNNTENDNFRDHMQAVIRSSVSMDQQEGHFAATFIVNKKNGVDSLKVINGINSDFDKVFVKNFDKNKLYWRAAMLNGKPVNTKVLVKFDYVTSEKMQPAMRLNNQANEALYAGKYDIALHFYQESLTYIPNDLSNIYRATLCKLVLGRGDGVCEALTQLNQSGTMIVDELINLACQPNKK